MSRDEVRIAVTFCRPSDGLGPVRFGAPVTPDLVDSFKPDAQSVALAIDRLAKLGFRVTRRGALTLSIRGSPQDFERHFATSLAPIHLTDALGGNYAADTVDYPPPNVAFQLHPNLRGLVEDAYIQWPHIYFNQRFDPPPNESPVPPSSIHYHHLRVPGDVSFLVGADLVHKHGITGRGVRLAMIDSGFAHGHAYFPMRGYNSSVVLAPGATDRDRDGNGHGTGESANAFAIAPDVTFIGIKLDNESDPFGGATILEALQEALSHDPDIISVSLGYDLALGVDRKHQTTLPNGLKAIEAEIEAAVAAGIVLVFSAGNGHVAFPGMMPDIISAGGVFVDADGAMQASNYASAFDSRIYPGRSVPDFCGLVGMTPGARYIALPIPRGCQIDQGGAPDDGTAPDDGWGVFSGTSAAAPQIAGACALLLQQDPSLSPSDIKAIFRRSSRDVVTGVAHAASNAGTPKPAGPGHDDATGAGLIDVFAAWQQL